MKNYLKYRLVLLSAFVSSVALAPVAHAQIDLTTELAAATTDLTTVITGIGGVLLAAAALAVGFKWAKAMFFG